MGMITLTSVPIGTLVGGVTHRDGFIRITTTRHYPAQNTLLTHDRLSLQHPDPANPLPPNPTDTTTLSTLRITTTHYDTIQLQTPRTSGDE
jgi:hypothetical protein